MPRIHYLRNHNIRIQSVAFQLNDPAAHHAAERAIDDSTGRRGHPGRSSPEPKLQKSSRRGTVGLDLGFPG